MKNKMTKSESVFKKKGFYVALYSCVGVVLVLAAAISFSNLNTPKAIVDPKDSSISKVEQTPAEEASKSTVESYLAQQQTKAVPEAWQEDETLDLPDVVMAELPQAKEPTIEAQKKIDSSTGTKASESKTVESKTAESTQKQSTTKKVETETEAKSETKVEGKTNTQIAKVEPANETVKQPNSLAEPMYKPYVEGNAMVWPTLGEIVMDYSVERLVFDKTLEQYRTNNDISISAQVGSQVRASADGVVKSISHSRENGYTVVIDHGNGWETSYSQLQENILVKKGDIVKASQVIGGVASPSIYSVLLGNHLAFAVTKDNRPIDPKIVLAK